jgi:hypothetical protein
MKICRILVCFMVIAFVGCVALPAAVGPGDKPDTVPPKIVKGMDNKKVWDRPDAFGPVPPEMQANGEKVCGALNKKAIGYHPKAQDENGKEFPGGGYLCVPDK